MVVFWDCFAGAWVQGLETLECIYTVLSIVDGDMCNHDPVSKVYVLRSQRSAISGGSCHDFRQLTTSHLFTS